MRCRKLAWLRVGCAHVETFVRLRRVIEVRVVEDVTNTVTCLCLLLAHEPEIQVLPNRDQIGDWSDCIEHPWSWLSLSGQWQSCQSHKEN